MTILGDNTLVTEATKTKIREAQCKEVSEHHIYKALSRRTKEKHNIEALEKIAGDELEHLSPAPT
jgi:hypothetical protein